MLHLARSLLFGNDSTSNTDALAGENLRLECADAFAMAVCLHAVGSTKESDCLNM